MNLVTCSMCNIKTDELKWNEHLVCTNHLELGKTVKDENAKIFVRNDL